ncbi:MAG: precorrin-2 C(20)-methyltransferase [Coriobacteriia bacterium]|nr:precorrin-2 C(20)-methyltransferase [Coriobacteriia bacterium]
MTNKQENRGKMKAKLYGIGTGPGDPELLTIKAVKAIEKCAVIAVPTHSGEDRTAYSIIEPYAMGKEILECEFAMSKDMDERVQARLVAAGRIMDCLDSGKDVGFITLGDSTTYSTYMYVHEIVVAKGYEAEVIPGVTSYAAAAAALGTALCAGDEMLMVIPARHSLDTEALLDFPGNKVLMKSGANLLKVLDELKARGLSLNTQIVSRATMEGQRLYRSIAEFEADPDTGYFTVAIVKEDKQ